jgi:hypothetical protein
MAVRVVVVMVSGALQLGVRRSRDLRVVSRVNMVMVTTVAPGMMVLVVVVVVPVNLV